MDFHVDPREFLGSSRKDANVCIFQLGLEGFVDFNRVRFVVYSEHVEQSENTWLNEITED